MIKFFLVRVAAFVTLAAGMALVGCQTSNEISKDSVWMNPTPEMESIAYTPTQRNTNIVRSWNTNLRQVVDDWDSFFLIDKPLHLSLYPIP